MKAALLFFIVRILDKQSLKNIASRTQRLRIKDLRHARGPRVSRSSILKGAELLPLLMLSNVRAGTLLRVDDVLIAETLMVCGLQACAYV